MLPFSHLRCWLALFMCAVWLMCVAQSHKSVLKNSDGDEFTIQYTVKHQEGKTVISFEHVSDIRLGNKNKTKYSQKQDKGLIRAIFMDGSNFNEDETKVEMENDIVQWSQFTTPAHWKYGIQDKSNVFCLNDRNSHPEISFTGERDQAILKIPIYLAYISSKDKHYWYGKKKGVITSYHIFSEFKPLEINLTIPKVKSEKPAPNQPQPKHKEVQVIEDSLVIDSEPDSNLELNQPDLNAKKLIKEIERELEKGSGLSDYEALEFYDQLKPKIESLEKLKNEASDEVRQEIDNLKGRYDDGRNDAEKQIEVINNHDGYVLGELDKLDNRLDSCTWRRLGLIDDIEKVYQSICQEYKDKVSPAVQHKLTDFNQKIIEVKKRLKPYLIIRKVLLGLLAFITLALSLLGYSRWKNNLEQKKMKSFEAMQQKMVRRAENEAKRRAQSVARNKTHQMVGKAKQKGRQAVRSGVTELGERARGKKPEPGSNDIPSIGSQPPPSRPSVEDYQGTRFKPKGRGPKPGSNGEISI